MTMPVPALLVTAIAALQAGPAAPPMDWAALPAVRWKTPPRHAPAASDYVRAEVAAGRCTAGQRSARLSALRIDLAVLAGADGRVRAVVPRAINCPTVEQYTAGLIQRMARDNLDTAGRAADTWYRAAMIYSWDE
jgi:hypothetical protein